MDKEKLQGILESHEVWINGNGGIRANLSGEDLCDADLRDANLRGANIDYACLTLWCGSLLVNMDDRQVKQLLYHTLSIVKNSTNVTKELKEKLLTSMNIAVAKEFHRSDECNKL